MRCDSKPRGAGAHAAASRAKRNLDFNFLAIVFNGFFIPELKSNYYRHPSFIGIVLEALDSRLALNIERAY